MISRDSLKGITSVIAVGLAIFQIYFTAGFGIIDSQLLRTIHLGIVLALVFLYFPPKKLQEGEREHPGWLALDLVLICGAFATAYFLASDIDYYMEGANAIAQLTPESRVLIAEACTHAPLTEDIGRVKIPNMLRKRIGEGLQIDIVSGTDFAEDMTL